eukprot:497977_1
MSIKISIRVYLNKELDKTEMFDKSQDISVNIIYDDRDIELEDLVNDIRSKFRKKGQSIKNRFRDKSYVTKFFSYSNEDIEIEDNDDLIAEIDDIFPDEDYSNEIDDKSVELRAVFHKKKQLCRHNQDPKTCLKCNPKPIELIPPQLIMKRLDRYYDYKVQRMAYKAIFQWNAINQYEIDEKSNDILLYDVEEMNTKSNLLSGRNISCLTYTAKTLEANKQYAFQIKSCLMTNNVVITESKYSEPISVNTPFPPKLLPRPMHLQVVTLLPDRLFIKFDPGFVHESNHKMRYWFKEKNVYGSVPFGIAEYPRPAGGFSKEYPVIPNIWYQIIVYCEDLNTNQQGLESKPLFIKSPVNQNVFNYNYKPQIPENFEAVYDRECKEIEVFWDVPKETYGDSIQYEIKMNDEGNYEIINNLPCRISMKTQILEIVTVCEFQNNSYRSDQGLYVIDVTDIDNIRVQSMDGMNMQ